MDGSATTPLAERTRLQISQAFQNRSANVANAHGELFEQLLSLSFSVQPPAKEPDSEVVDSSVVAEANLHTDNEKVATADDEKEDAATPPTALLTPAIPLIAEQPAEPVADPSVVDTHSNTEALTPVELGTTGDTVPIIAVATDSVVCVQESVQTDTQVDQTDKLAPESTVAAGPAADLNSEDATTALARRENDSNNKKAVPATKLESAHRDPTPDLADNNKRESNASPLSPSEDKNKPAVATSPTKDETKDRRGDRNEKWFERKEEPLSVSAEERPFAPTDSSLSRENFDPATVVPQETPTQSSTADATTAVAEPLIVPATPFTVTQPAALSAAAQGVMATATPAPTTTATSNSDSTNAVNPGPSRAVGSQATKSNPNGKTTEPGLSQQERVRVIQRIARSFNRLSTEGGTINLRLHPQHLGSVSMQVRLEGRSLSARLSTETAAARDAIMQDLPALRQRLADQGFDVTKFQVDVASNGADASFAQSNGQQQSGQSENRSSGSQTDYRRFAANREPRTVSTRQLLPAANQAWQSGSGIDLQA